MRLASGEVHVWDASIQATEKDRALYEGWLDPAEKDRAGRYYFAEDRRKYVCGRGLLRSLSSAYLGLDPARLAYVRGGGGKPCLARPWEGLRFNLSHSGDRVLLAFSLDREVGVDVERLREGVPAEPIARACFSMEDRARLASAPGDRRTSMFFRLWTRLEAGLKSRGWGLARWQEHLRAASPAAEGLKECALYDLNGQPGYAAALAVGPSRCAAPLTLRTFHFPDHLETKA